MMNYWNLHEFLLFVCFLFILELFFAKLLTSSNKIRTENSSKRTHSHAKSNATKIAFKYNLNWDETPIEKQTNAEIPFEKMLNLFEWNILTFNGFFSVWFGGRNETNAKFRSNMNCDKLLGYFYCAELTRNVWLVFQLVIISFFFFSFIN